MGEGSRETPTDLPRIFPNHSYPHEPRNITTAAKPILTFHGGRGIGSDFSETFPDES